MLGRGGLWGREELRSRGALERARGRAVLWGSYRSHSGPAARRPQAAGGSGDLETLAGLLVGLGQAAGAAAGGAGITKRAAYPGGGTPLGWAGWVGTPLGRGLTRGSLWGWGAVCGTAWGGLWQLQEMQALRAHRIPRRCRARYVALGWGVVEGSPAPRRWR